MFAGYSVVSAATGRVALADDFSCIFSTPGGICPLSPTSYESSTEKLIGPHETAPGNIILSAAASRNEVRTQQRRLGRNTILYRVNIGPVPPPPDGHRSVVRARAVVNLRTKPT